MSQQTESIKTVLPEAKMPNIVRGKFPILIVGLLLLLVAVALFVALADRSPTSEVETAAWSLAADPELMVAQRYAAEKAEASFLADNPELMFALRYTGAAAEGAQASHLVAKPELTRAQRWAIAAEKKAKVTGLANASRYARPSARGLERNHLGINPELMAAGRYGAEVEEQEIPFAPVESVNRELQPFYRYTSMTESQEDDESTTLNPDLRHFRPH